MPGKKIIGIDCRTLERQPTGVGRYLKGLIDCWAADQNIEDVGFNLYFKKEVPRQLLKLPPSFSARLTKGPLGIQSNLLYYNVLLPRQAIKDKIDLLFSPFYMLPKLWSGRSVVTIHDVSYKAYPEWFDVLNRIQFQRLTKEAIKKADLILTPSRFTSLEIKRLYGRTDGVEVVYLGVDERFTKKITSNQKKIVKRKYGINADNLILFTGDIFNRRHVPELIKAFGQLANKFPDWQLLVSGRNRTHPFIDIEKMIAGANRSLARRAVVRSDWIDEDDLPAVYQAAQIFCWPSSYEGFGLPVLEAMSSGAAVLTTNCASLPEIAGSSAVLVKGSIDSGSIEEALLELMRDARLRGELARRALGQAKKFSWQRCSQETLKQLKKALPK